MSLQSTAMKWFGFLLFLIGAGIGLSLSGVMAWGEMEANLASNPPDSKALDLKCPLMLSFDETGSVQGRIINETDKEVKPVVTAGFGQPDTLDQQQVAQTYILTARETQTIQWPVDASQAAFGRVIPVSVLQSRYSHNPPRWGACGILIFSLFGLSGSLTLAIIIGLSLLSLSAGILFIRKASEAQAETNKSLKQAGTLLAILTILVLVCSVSRWWGLTILFETISAITLITILVDIIVPHHKQV